MVQAVINIGDRANRVLNIIKAKYALKDKSEAITLVVSTYEENFLEPELRPEYIEKLNKKVQALSGRVKKLEGIKGEGQEE